MKILVPALFLTLVSSRNAFQPKLSTTSRFSRTSTSLKIVLDDQENVVDKINRILQDESIPPVHEEFDQMVKYSFPGAISNNEFERRVVQVLAEKGFTAGNTLLATSLCSDELAKRLSDDFVKVYGNNFNLGGLAGFPFAGNIGFETMSGHIPDNGYCLVVYGPHVGISYDGTVGRVEREGVALIDSCCRSAIEASDYVLGFTEGVQSFTDFQQGAVQELVLPHANRLQVSEDPMLELPYALFETQNQLIQEIINAGVGRTKEGIALLGGIQINTGPASQDYFHPLRFDLMNNKGEILDDLLPYLSYSGY